MNFTRKQLILAAAIGGGVAALGTLLPWYSWSVEAGPYSSSGSISGLDTGARGVLVLLCGLAGGAAALLVHLGKAGTVVKLNELQHLWIATGALGLCLLLTLIQFFNTYSQAGWSGYSGAHAGRGIGLWLSLLGSLAGGIAAFLTVKGTSPMGAAKPPAP